jgi:hypothetical protein
MTKLTGVQTGNAWASYDIYRHNPWRAPGHAPVADPCGLAGGTPWAAPSPEEGRYYNTSFAHHGMKGTALKSLPRDVYQPEKWTIGGTAEVSWNVWANHGGGCECRAHCTTTYRPAAARFDCRTLAGLVVACDMARVAWHCCHFCAAAFVQILTGCAPPPSHSRRHASRSIRWTSCPTNSSSFSRYAITPLLRTGTRGGYYRRVLGPEKLPRTG